MNELTGSAADDVRKRIEVCKRDHANSYLQLGAILQLVRDDKLWKEFGFQSFAQFVTEHGLSRAWAYQCVAVVERWGQKAQGILPSRLQALLPIKCESPDVETELLEAARTYQAEAFRNVIVDRKGGNPTDNCPHEVLGSYCTNCGKHL